MAKNAGKATSAVLLRGECNGPASIVLIKSTPWSIWLILFPLFGPLSQIVNQGYETSEL
mgnify:FL=1